MSDDAVFVNYDELNPDNVISLPPESKTIANKNISYNVIPLRYNYNGVTDNIYIQFPDVVTYGINENTYDDGSTSKSVSMSYPQDNEDKPEYGVFKEKWDSFFWKTGQIIFDAKMAGGAKTLEAFMDGGAYTNPLCEPKDRVTKEIIAGKPIRINAALIGTDSKMSRNKTIFYKRNGEEARWVELMGLQVTLRPLVKVRDLFLGTVNKPRIDLYSAVVLDIEPFNMVPRQLSVIDKINKEDPEKAKALEEKFNKMRLEREKDKKAEKDQPKEVKETKPAAPKQAAGKSVGKMATLKGAAKQPPKPQQTIE